MDAVNTCRLLGLDRSLCSATNTHIKIKALISSLPCYQFIGPNLVPRCGNFALPSRLRVSYGRNKGLQQCFRAPRISCMLEDSDGDKKQTEQLDSPQEAAIDLKLPRRSLLVTFTCDACGARSQRLINRLAYERGLVYVQCSGCSHYHKLVDNLGLVIEYNLQEGIDPRASADQA